MWRRRNPPLTSLSSVVKVKRSTVAGAQIMVPEVILHDLSSPLSSLAGVFNLLDWEKVDESNKELLVAGEQALAQALRMINNTFPDTKQNGTAEASVHFEVESIVSMALSALGGVISELGIDLKYQNCCELKLAGDAIIFERIMLNVLMNAIQALRKANGTRKLTIVCSQTGRKLCISVKDNAIGIDKDKLKALLDSEIILTKGRKKITGLQFVKMAIKEYFAGWMEIDSILGKGTEVRLYFIV